MNRELGRVSDRIADAVVWFWFYRCRSGNSEFRADELRAYVSGRGITSAPGSADRVLRNLRRQHVINYRLVSRSKSLYEALPRRKKGAK